MEGKGQPDRIDVSGTSLALAPLALALAGLCTTLWIFYPGIMTNDSVSSYEQALTESFDDWHPPVMAFIWHYTNLVFPGPGGVLLLNALLFWGGLFSLGQALKNRGATLPFLTVLTGFLPMCFTTLGHIWKDALLAASWLCAVGLFARFYRSKIVLVFVFGLLVVGTLSRANAIFGLPPLLWLIARQWTSSRRAAMALTAALFVMAAASAPIVNYGLLKAKRSHVEQSLMLFDIGAISQISGADYLNVTSGDEKEKFLTGCYEPWAWDDYAWGDCSFVLQRTKEAGVWDNGSMLGKWLVAIKQHPLIYAEHRLDNFSILMTSPQSILVTSGPQNPQGFQLFNAPAVLELGRIVETLQDWRLFKPTIWFYLSCVIAVAAGLSVSSFERDLALTLIGSAWMYAAGYILVGVAFDFRYLYWSFVAISASVPCLAASLSKTVSTPATGADLRSPI